MMIQSAGQIQISFKVALLCPLTSFLTLIIAHQMYCILWVRIIFSTHSVSESLRTTLYSGCSVRQKMILSVFRNLQIFLFHLASNLSHLFQLEFTIIQISQSCLSTLSKSQQYKVNKYQEKLFLKNLPPPPPLSE